MINKIAVIAILISIFIAGNLLAFDDMPGVVVTLIDEDENVIPDQLIICEMHIDGQITIDYDFTDVDGEANFGAAGDEGIYFMITEYDGVVYNNTVAKNPGQRILTWQVGIPSNPE